MMQYGSEKENIYDQEGSVVSIESAFHKGDVAKRTKHIRARTKVANAQEETTEYLEWSSRIKTLRENKLLALDPDSDNPSFVIQFPKNDKDGSYFIIKCWSEVL